MVCSHKTALWLLPPLSTRGWLKISARRENTGGSVRREGSGKIKQWNVCAEFHIIACDYVNHAIVESRYLAIACDFTRLAIMLITLSCDST